MNATKLKRMKKTGFGYRTFSELNIRERNKFRYEMRHVWFDLTRYIHKFNEEGC